MSYVIKLKIGNDLSESYYFSLNSRSVFAPYTRNLNDAHVFSESDIDIFVEDLQANGYTVLSVVEVNRTTDIVFEHKYKDGKMVGKHHD